MLHSMGILCLLEEDPYVAFVFEESWLRAAAEDLAETWLPPMEQSIGFNR